MSLTIPITAAEIRAEQVRLWGEAKVAADEADVARRFAHLNHRGHTGAPNLHCRRCVGQVSANG